jgi:very-short-patch-repair endonuclease
MKAIDLPEPEREYRFHPVRRWRFDFAWPELKVAAEVEGGVYVKGRHNRGSGFVKDCEKYAEALLLGWKVIRIPSPWVNSGQALDYVERLVKV